MTNTGSEKMDKREYRESMEASLAARHPALAAMLAAMSDDDLLDWASKGGERLVKDGTSPNGMHCRVVARADALSYDSYLRVICVADDGREQVIQPEQVAQMLTMVK